MTADSSNYSERLYEAKEKLAEAKEKVVEKAADWYNKLKTKLSK